jgi:D-alanyl-lipoteichoic acid acyltransferase DltB (MBOAT superfamily)
MLFNSHIFILLFLPLTLVSYYLFSKNTTGRIYLLLIASLIFYGYWDYRFVPFLVFSIIMNWIVVQLYSKYNRVWLIAFGIVVNLAFIGFFKYTNFLADSIFFLQAHNIITGLLFSHLASAFLHFNKFPILLT